MTRQPVTFAYPLYLGIDPGLAGAATLLDSNGDLFEIFDTPIIHVGREVTKKKIKTIREYNLIAIRLWLDAHHDVIAHAAVEYVNAMPRAAGIIMGAQSMFRMGYGFGIWEAMLAAFTIRYTRIRPTEWKPAMLPGMGREKEVAIQRAQQLFPTASLARKKDDGRAESALIAEYLRRQHTTRRN